MITPCFNTMGTPDWNIHQVINFAHEIGFTFVEIRVLENNLNICQLNCFSNPSKRKDLNKELEDKSLNILCLNLSHHLMGYNKSSKEEIIKYADIADALDIPYLRFFAGEGEYTKPLTQDEFNRMFASLQKINELLKDYKTQLLLETHDILVKTRDVLKFQEQFDHAIPILWDFEHIMLKGKEDWKTSLETLKPYIHYVHIKDIKIINDQTIHTFLFDGEMPVREMLDIYRQMDREIIVSFEWEKYWFPDIPHGKIAIKDFYQKISKYN